MKEKDYSKEILEKYYHPEGKILKITLLDNSIIRGIFTGFFHGDAEDSPYIIKWHFIDKKDISKFNKFAVSQNEKLGKIIEQKDIKNVTFE